MRMQHPSNNNGVIMNTYKLSLLASILLFTACGGDVGEECTSDEDCAEGLECHMHYGEEDHGECEEHEGDHNEDTAEE